MLPSPPPLSPRTQHLLSKPEDGEVEFKETVEGLKESDFVAFANSPRGGTILIGVREIEINGQQQGKIVGCDVSDKARVGLLNRAASCIPPIDLNLHIEGYGVKAFWRIEIASSPHKPHCTASGRYSIRDNGRNNALHPTQLLTLFLQREEETFTTRFALVTNSLQAEAEATQARLTRLERKIDSLLQKLGSELP